MQSAPTHEDIVSHSVELHSVTTKQSNVVNRDIIREKYNPIYDHFLETLIVFVYIARYVLLLTTICLFIISLMYGISNLLTLEATNFFCPLYSREEVLQHNLENGMEHGSSRYSCWYINRSKINLLKIILSQEDLFEATFKHVTVINLFKFLLYCLISLWLLFMILYNGYYLIYDTCFTLLSCINNKIKSRIVRAICNCPKEHIHNPRVTNALNHMRYKVKTQNKLRRKRSLSRSKLMQFNQDKGKTKEKQSVQSKFGATGVRKLIIDKYQQWILWYRKYYYQDSKWRLFTIMGKEWLEILVQTYVLFLFGGINIFNLESNVLAQDSSVVRQFSIIVGLNSVIAGVVQLCYVICGNFIRGNVFLTIYFVIDTAFECTYILFPLLSLNNNNDSAVNPKRLALLTQENNGFILLQSLFAIIFITNKSLFLMNQLNPKIIIVKHWQQKLLKIDVNSDNTSNISVQAQEPWIHNDNYNKRAKICLTNANRSSTKFKHVALYTAITLGYVRERQRNKQTTVTTTATETTKIRAAKENSVTSTVSNARNDLRLDLGTVSNSVSGSISTTLMIANCGLVAGGQTTSSTTSTNRPDATKKHHQSLGVENQEIEKQIYKTEKQSNITQLKRKSVIIFCGLLYIVVGLLIVISFTSFIDNEFNDKCLNINSNNNRFNDTYSNGSIIYTTQMRYYYDMYCSQKSIRMFDDYPCNCRQLNIDQRNNLEVYGTDTPIPFKYIESMLSKFDNLEKIWMVGPTANEETRAQYNFTSGMIKNLNHLKIFFIQQIDTYCVSQDISRLSNLEIFIMMKNDGTFFLPFDNGISHLCMFYQLHIILYL